MNNLTEKRKRLAAKRKTSWQKEKDSQQKEKPHGKKKKTQSKKKISRQKEKCSRQNFFDTERTFLISFAVRSSLFFLSWGYSLCREVFLFAVRLILFPWQLWATVPLKFCSRRFLIFQYVGIRENKAQTLLIWLAFKPYNSWTGPFRKGWTFLYVRQVRSENKAFKMQHSVSVVRPLFAVKNENTI